MTTVSEVRRVTALLCGVVIAACGGGGGGGGGDDGGGGPPPPPVVGSVFVVKKADTSVRIFPRTATGDPAPTRLIQGGNTQLSQPVDVEVDTGDGEIFVGNSGNDSITVYSDIANGNAAPLRVISGASTGLNFSPNVSSFQDHRAAIHYDPVNQEIWAINPAAPSITVHPKSANGDTAPSRTITGAATLLNVPRDLAVDTVNGEVFVWDSGGTACEVHVFARTANGNVAPVRTFSTSMGCPTNDQGGIDVDPANGEVWISDRAAPGLQVHGRTASGSSTPLRSYSRSCNDIMVDALNNEVACTTDASIQFISRSTGAFLRTIGGANSGLTGTNGATGVAVEP